MITEFKDPHFVGRDVLCHADFVPALRRVAELADGWGVQVYVTHSMRYPGRLVSGAVVKPATRSNHLVGHAIDMNVRWRGELFTSRHLADLANVPSDVRDFIRAINPQEDVHLRWGGTFATPDVVHIDDGLNLRDPEGWERKYNQLHGGAA